MSETSSRESPRLLRLVGVAAALAVAMLAVANPSVRAQPAPVAGSTCPVLDLANPSPGAQLSSGDLVVSGIAFDPIAQSTAGVARVDFFLGPQDTGGTIVGSVVPSQAPDPNNPHMFQTTVTLPNVDRLDTLVAYAHAATGGGTTSVSIPVQVGQIAKSDQPATPMPVPSSLTVKSDCPTGAVLSPSGVSVTTSTAPVVAVKPSQGPTLELANPHAEDVVTRGSYVVSGVAFDPASTDGAGVDRVDFFLEPRDSGGTQIGTTVPGLGGRLGAFAATVKFPSDASGGHQFVAYAHSAITGLESAVSVPVFVGVMAAPTPHP